MILVPRPVTEWASSRLISTSRRSWGTVTVIVIDDFRLTGTFTLIPPRSSSVDGFTQLFVLCFAVVLKSFISSFHFCLSVNFMQRSFNTVFMNLENMFLYFCDENTNSDQKKLSQWSKEETVRTWNVFDCIGAADSLFEIFLQSETLFSSRRSTRQGAVESNYTTICPAGIYCGLLVRILQAAFNKHIQTFSNSTQPSLRPVVSFPAVITLVFPQPPSQVSQRGRKQKRRLISCNGGKSCRRLKAAHDQYGRHFYMCLHMSSPPGKTSMATETRRCSEKSSAPSVFQRIITMYCERWYSCSFLSLLTFVRATAGWETRSSTLCCHSRKW